MKCIIYQIIIIMIMTMENFNGLLRAKFCLDLLIMNLQNNKIWRIIKWHDNIYSTMINLKYVYNYILK